jgi:glutathione S-transferase
MSLKLYFHPLASFCHKALIALYENGIPFEPIIVDLRDEVSSAAFRAISPMAKMPVLRDEARSRTVAESTIIIEFVDAHYPGPTQFVPTDMDRAWQTRMWDRFYDHYVQEPMQKIVTDRLRPEGKNDAYGVELAKVQLHAAYGVIEQECNRRSGRWATTSPWPTARRRRRCSMRIPSFLLPRRTKICWPISTASWRALPLPGCSRKRNRTSAYSQWRESRKSPDLAVWRAAEGGFGHASAWKSIRVCAD